MNLDGIIRKHWRAIDDLTHHKQDALSDDAILLAISLAAQDAAALAQPAPNIPEIERAAVGQLTILTEWLAEAEPNIANGPIRSTADAVLAAIKGREDIIDDQKRALVAAQAEIDALRQQLAQMDADNAYLTQRLTDKDAYIAAVNTRMVEALAAADNANRENTALQAEIDRLTRQNVIAVGTLNSHLAERTNGNGASAGSATGANPTPAALPVTDWGRNCSAWTGLSDDQRTTVYRLTNGEITFRKISREDRIDLVGRVLRHLADGGEPVTGPLFDRLKPAWMPTAGAVVLLAESRKWNDLLKLAGMPTPA